MQITYIRQAVTSLIAAVPATRLGRPVQINHWYRQPG